MSHFYPSHSFINAKTLPFYIRHPADCVGLDSVLVSSCGRAYLESVLVDTALVLLHGRVIRALSLLRLSSLAPCQRARRLLSRRGSLLIAPCFPDIFLSDEPERLNRRGNRPIIGVCSENHRRCSDRRENVSNISTGSLSSWENSPGSRGGACSFSRR